MCKIGHIDIFCMDFKYTCRVMSPDNTDNRHTIKIKNCLVRLNIEGVVRVQHPTVLKHYIFNNGSKFGRVLSHDNTNNRHTIKIKNCLVRLNIKGVVRVQHPTVWMKIDLIL